MFKKVLAVLASLAAIGAVLVLVSPTLRTQTSGEFNAENAFAYLKKQTDFGTRVPGTKAHAECKDYLVAEISKYAAKVEQQHFTVNISGKRLPMTNIIAFTNPDASRQFLLAAHWDTRPIADQEVLPEKRKQPIPGANDGASGVAVLLEAARVFSIKKPNVGLVFVFFDGEDYGPTDVNMYLGSKHFAADIKNSLRCDGKPVQVEAGILLDMVGDKDLNIHKEVNSVEAAPKLVDDIWAMAKKLGYSKYFIDTVKYQITDDHLPLIEAGIPTVDIIDFDFPYWHTLEDTADKCSGESLKVVGDVVCGFIYSLKP